MYSASDSDMSPHVKFYYGGAREATQGTVVLQCPRSAVKLWHLEATSHKFYSLYKLGHHPSSTKSWEKHSISSKVFRLGRTDGQKFVKKSCCHKEEKQSGDCGNFFFPNRKHNAAIQQLPARLKQETLLCFGSFSVGFTPGPLALQPWCRRRMARARSDC